MAAALQSFWQMRLCYYFSFQTLPLSLALCLSVGCWLCQTLNVLVFIPFCFSFLIFTHELIAAAPSASSSSSPPHLQPRPASETAVKTVWNLCNPAEEKNPARCCCISQF